MISGQATRICRICLTSQVSARYIVYVIVLFMVLVILLEMSHLDAINRLQNNIRTSYRSVDKQLEEQLKQFYQSNVNATVRGGYKYNNVKDSERFTLILQTYNRTDVLMKLLNHYSAVPRLDKIIVVWNNIDEQPPLEVWVKYAPHPVPVLFLRQNENKMRNRLQPFKQIETKAVLIMDDDLMASANDINFAFSVWQQFSDLIVGFVPRKHILSTTGIYMYGSFELESEPVAINRVPMYSMILVGAAFFKTEYLQMFAAAPVSVHEMIDETENCDDISFNVIIANHFNKRGTPKCPGIYVKPTDLRNLERDAMSGYIGMWHHADHMLERSYCLNKLAHIYNGLPLQYSNVQISQFNPFHD